MQHAPKAVWEVPAMRSMVLLQEASEHMHWHAAKCKAHQGYSADSEMAQPAKTILGKGFRVRPNGLAGADSQPGESFVPYA